MGLWGPWMLRQRLPHPRCLLCSPAPMTPPPSPQSEQFRCGPSPQLVSWEAQGREPQTPETKNQCVWVEGRDCVGQDGGGRVKGEFADATPTCSTQLEAASCLPPP